MHFVTGALNTKVPFTAAKAIRILSNDTDNTYCFYMHGTNSTNPDCFKVNGISVVSALSNTNNKKNLFFHVCTGSCGRTCYGDGSHDNQPATMAAIAACEAEGALAIVAVLQSLLIKG